MTNNNQSLDSFGEEQSKDKGNPTQLKTIFNYWFENTVTASMVADATGIPQKNICRYKRDLEIAGKLFEIVKKECVNTGFKAWYITTNPNKAIIRTNQLNLFDYES